MNLGLKANLQAWEELCKHFLRGLNILQTARGYKMVVRNSWRRNSEEKNEHFGKQGKLTWTSVTQLVLAKAHLLWSVGVCLHATSRHLGKACDLQVVMEVCIHNHSLPMWKGLFWVLNCITSRQRAISIFQIQSWSTVSKGLICMRLFCYFGNSKDSLFRLFEYDLGM